MSNATARLADLDYMSLGQLGEWVELANQGEDGHNRSLNFFITHIVLCELVWVLRGATYSFRKEEITHVLEAMLHSAAFEFENRSTAGQALHQYQQGKADFSDYLIGAVSQQAGCSETVSFDGKLKGERGFQ